MNTNDIRNQTFGVIADTITNAGGDTALLTGIDEEGRADFTVAIVVGPAAAGFRRHLEEFFAEGEQRAVGDYDQETGEFSVQTPAEEA